MSSSFERMCLAGWYRAYVWLWVTARVSEGPVAQMDRGIVRERERKRIRRDSKVSSCCAWTFIGSSWSKRWIGFRVRQGWVTTSFDAWLAVMISLRSWSTCKNVIPWQRKFSQVERIYMCSSRGYICVFSLACSKLRAFNLCICVCVWLLSFILSEIPPLNSLQKYQLYRQVHLHQMLRQQQREQVQLGSPALMPQSSAFLHGWTCEVKLNLCHWNFNSNM